ncbi:MAG: CIA30 family protein [Planctomycetota bacterium]
MWSFLSTSALLSGTIASAIVASGVLEQREPVGVPGGALTQEEPGTESRLIASFDGTDPESDDLSGRWQTVNDTVMGGRSVGGGEIRGGALVLSGTLNTNGGGFSSVRASDKRWDLSGFEGVTARVRGDGRTYMIQFRTGQQVQGRTVSYRGEFTADAGWTEVFVPFNDLSPSWRGQDLSAFAEPINPSDIRSLGVMLADGRDGPFRVEVDWIRATAASVSTSGLAAVQSPTDDGIELASFDGDEANIDPISGTWRVVNDNIMGGRSDGGGAMADGVLTFSGSTNTNGGGFSSLRAGDKRWDLHEFDAMAARIRADGRTYVFHVQTNLTANGGTVFYRGEFETDAAIDASGSVLADDAGWQVVRVPFEKFDPFVRGRNLRGTVPGLDPAEIRSIGIMIDDGLDGPFRLEADWFKAVRDGGNTLRPTNRNTI